MNIPDFTSITLAKQSAELLAKAEHTDFHPTPAQAEAGNYAKRKMAWHGLTISIENEPGSVRKGNGWQTKMLFPYGYIKSVSLSAVRQSLVKRCVTESDSAGNLPDGLVLVKKGIDYLPIINMFISSISAFKSASFDKSADASFSNIKNSSCLGLANTIGDHLGCGFNIETMESRGGINPLIAKAGGDCCASYAMLFGDAIKGLLVGSVGFNALNINDRSVVQRHMISAFHDDKIFRSVIELLPVYVMNVFLGVEKPADFFLRNKPVFLDRLSIPLDDSVWESGSIFIDAIAAYHPIAFAALVAKEMFESGNLEIATLDCLSAVIARNDRHFTSSLKLKGYYNTEGADGDHIDVYVGPDESAEMVYVVHQRKYGDWSHYDEDKAMICFSSEADAKAAYLKHYDDPRFLGPITAMPVAEFVEKARNANGRMVKSITLVFPNGNEHEIFQGAYSFDADNELLKATQLAAGQRWITVHPNGAGSTGVPVMVQEAQHGSGVFHVIGGAGGKLNYLKLRGLKPESSYKEHAAEKAKTKRDAKKQQRARDKELGIDHGKKQARESVQSQRRMADQAFVQKVADKMGWKAEDLEPKIPENVSDATRQKIEHRHHSELLKRANSAVELQHQNLLTDAMAREEAGGVSVEPNEHTDSAKLTVADLDDAHPQGASGLGFSAHYAERAAANGATEEVIQQEATGKKESRQSIMSEAQRSAIKARGDTARQIKSEIETIREPISTNVKAVLASASDAVELIKAQKEWKSVQKAAQAANKDIDEAKEVKAYNLEVSAPDDSDIQTDIENDLRTIRTKAFLSTIDKEADDPEKAMRQHIGAGAFNSINALALTAGGAALIDRSVVDVLGVGGAAQVLARRLHADLPADEMDKLTSGMEDFHLHHYMETSKEAMQEAQELHDAAKEIGLGEASHGADFEAARELLHRRKAAVEQAHKILGTALGEMEANAALVTALKGGRSDKPMEVPLGKVSDEDAIRQVRAIGLQRGDYSIDRVAGNQVLTITPDGLDRLAKPVDREELNRTRDTLAILNGEHDEDDWLPQGFAKRPDLALDLKPGVAATLARPFNPTGDMRQAIKDYIGGRAADGDSPDAIVEDLQSADFFQKSGNAEAYREALDEVAARTGKDGKLLRNEDLSEMFNEYADSFVQREYGGKIATIQRQNFEADAVAQDALHRALADTPEGIAAYKPIGELTTDDQQTLRKFFHANVAHESDEAATLRERLDGMTHIEPEKESQNMFGEKTTNPEWQAWDSQRAALKKEVDSNSLKWGKYASAMGGHENAYATTQDMIRSKVAKSFNENYNKLNPNAPLKMGRQVVRNNLSHLDVIDPEARAARQASDKEREANGQYASVAGSLEEREAAKQAQMGFFSTEQDDMFGDHSGDASKKVEKPLSADERYTLGHAAERTIAAMMPVIGQNFKPGRPLK